MHVIIPYFSYNYLTNNIFIKIVINDKLHLKKNYTLLKDLKIYIECVVFTHCCKV